jgi:excisionase family DNA binding protein
VTTDPRRYASLPAAAEYLGTSVNTIRNLVNSGRLTRYAITARLIRVDLSEIDLLADKSVYRRTRRVATSKVA